MVMTRTINTMFLLCVFNIVFSVDERHYAKFAPIEMSLDRGLTQFLKPKGKRGTHSTERQRTKRTGRQSTESQRTERQRTVIQRTERQRTERQRTQRTQRTERKKDRVGNEIWLGD